VNLNISPSAEDEENTRKELLAFLQSSEIFDEEENATVIIPAFSEADNDSAWFRYKPDMLRWKAVARVVRIGAADVMKGVAVREDMDRSDDAIDITPLPEIPDLPDIPDEAPVKQITQPKQPADLIADQAGFISMVQSSLSACESRKEIAEVVTSNADVTKRCSPSNRQRIAELYREALA
jgi:hypothetical protein